MAISQKTAWECRASAAGNPNNGGGFDASFGGVDYTRRNTPQIVLNGSTIKFSASGATATVTVAGYTVSLNDRGNILIPTGGTNVVTTRPFQIISVNTAANTWTLDANVTTGATSNGAGNVGGALPSPALFSKYMSDAAAGQAGWTLRIRNQGIPGVPTIYSLSATANVDGGRMSFTRAGSGFKNGLSTRIIGCVSSDLPNNTEEKPVLSQTNNNPLCGLGGNAFGIEWFNVRFTGGGSSANGSNVCFSTNFDTIYFERCEFYNFGGGATESSSVACLDCKFERCALSSALHTIMATGYVKRCTFLNCGGIYIWAINHCEISETLLASLNGPSISFGIYVDSNSAGNVSCKNVTFDGFARDGLTTEVAVGGAARLILIEDCLFTNLATNGVKAKNPTNGVRIKNCAFYNCATDVSANVLDAPQNKISLSQSPYRDGANSDFWSRDYRLNNAFGGGADCIGIGSRAALPGFGAQGAAGDAGAYQSVGSSSSSPAALSLTERYVRSFTRAGGPEFIYQNGYEWDREMPSEDAGMRIPSGDTSGGDGEYQADSFLTPRSLSAAITVISTSYSSPLSELQGKLDALMAAHPKGAAGVLREKILLGNTVIADRQIACRISDRSRVKTGLNYARANISYRSGSGAWTDTAYFAPIPLIVGGNFLTLGGTESCLPLITLVVTTAGVITLSDAATGQSLALNCVAGTYVVDSEQRTVTKDGVSALAAIVSGGFLQLSPYSSTFTLALDGTAAIASAQIAGRRRWTFA